MPNSIHQTNRAWVVLCYIFCMLVMIYNDATTSLEDCWLERVPFSFENMYPRSWVIPAICFIIFLFPLFWRVGADRRYSWSICLFPIIPTKSIWRTWGILITVFWAICMVLPFSIIFSSIKDTSDNDNGFNGIVLVFLGIIWGIITAVYFTIYKCVKHKS